MEVFFLFGVYCGWGSGEKNYREVCIEIVFIVGFDLLCSGKIIIEKEYLVGIREV